jgi:collagenase-like PrtC family protease
MKLCVPTNWQPDLLEGLDKSSIIEIYGKLGRDPVGGGRPAFVLPSISSSGAKRYIQEVHRQGLKFNYLLNATCLGNSEWSIRGQKRIRRFLDWLSDIGVDAITVSIPYLLELAKRCYPHFETKVSVCAQVSNATQAKYWEELGADEIALSPWSVNRNFGALKKIRQAVKCRLQLYANTRCLIGCPFVGYHYSSLSHSSNSSGINGDFFTDYCMYSCVYLTLLEPWRLIASCWIRPEDLHYYESAGINSVKLSERGMESGHIQRIVGAYTAEKYDGNLMDLLLDSSKGLAGRGKYTWKKIKFFLRPFKVDIFKLACLLGRIRGGEPAYLDNHSLEGFLRYFVEERCGQGNCDDCGYCRGIAEKSLRVPEDYRRKMAGAYKGLLAEIVGGGLFKAGWKNGKAG